MEFCKGSLILLSSQLTKHRRSYWSERSFLFFKNNIWNSGAQIINFCSTPALVQGSTRTIKALSSETLRKRTSDLTWLAGWILGAKKGKLYGPQPAKMWMVAKSCTSWYLWVSTCFNHPFGGAGFRNHPQFFICQSILAGTSTHNHDLTSHLGLEAIIRAGSPIWARGRRHTLGQQRKTPHQRGDLKQRFEKTWTYLVT